MFTSFLPLVVFHVLLRDPFHSVDLDLYVSAGRDRVRDFVDRLLVDLHAVDGQTRPRVQLFVTDMALEVLRLLMLDQNLLVVELAIAVPEQVERKDSKSGIPQRDMKDTEKV
jgi:hypothetical protein